MRSKGFVIIIKAAATHYKRAPAAAPEDILGRRQMMMKGVGSRRGERPRMRPPSQQPQPQQPPQSY